MDADVITDAAPETDEWFAARREGVTATDLPKILGLSRFGNARTLWHTKRGELADEEAGPAADWGHRLEDVICQWAADVNGWKLSPVGVLANREHPWRRAAPDRAIEGCPDGPCFLEAKNRSQFVAGYWREDMPDDVLAQVCWQAIVTGADHVHVVVLIGGNDPRLFRYDRDPDVEAYVIAAAEAFWGHLVDGTPPEVDAASALLAMFDRLYPDRSGATEVDRAEYAVLKHEYDRACALADTAESGKAWAKYRLVELIGPGTRAVAHDDPDHLLATYHPDLRETVDKDRLRSEFPDVHKAVVAKKPTAPILRWKKAH
jgi:putative phage-type endonuclease